MPVAVTIRHRAECLFCLSRKVTLFLFTCSQLHLFHCYYQLTNTYTVAECSNCFCLPIQSNTIQYYYPIRSNAIPYDPMRYDAIQCDPIISDRFAMPGESSLLFAKNNVIEWLHFCTLFLPRYMHNKRSTNKNMRHNCAAIEISSSLGQNGILFYFNFEFPV